MLSAIHVNSGLNCVTVKIQANSQDIIFKSKEYEEKLQI